MRKLSQLALLLFVGSFFGCGGSGTSGGGNNPPPAPTLQSIAVTPATPSINSGATQQFTATGNYSDGSTKNLTSTANWLSSSASVATVNTTGLATGASGGTTTISASFGGVVGSTTLTVVALQSITVTPNPVSLAPNNTQQFTATGNYSDGSTKNLTAAVNWQSSNSRIASISGGGLATGIAPGNVTISASLSGVTGTTSLTVANPLQAITVTPANSSVAPGTKPQFTAIGTYFDNSSNDITAAAGVTWSSSNTSVATISNSQGTQGLATAIATGQTAITATCTPPAAACPTGSSVSGSTSLTVKNVTIVSILVTPANAPLPLGLQQQYDALATLSDGTTQDVTNVVNWASSDTTKVTITTSALATAVGVTTSPITISATAKNGVVGMTTVTVNAGNLVSIAIKPLTPTTLAQGTSRQYTAIGTLNNGSTLNITNQVTWSLQSANGIATIGQKTGVVKANPSIVQPHNPITISAMLGSVQQSVPLDVTNATPTSITVTPVTATVQVGATQTFHATAVFTDGTSQDITLDALWRSSKPSEANVVYPGRLQGKMPTGNNGLTVTAAFGGVSGIANLVVTGATLTSITMTPSSANLAPGSSTTIQATGNYNDGSTANLTGLAAWVSSNKSVATVSNGVVLGQSAGPANITATYQSNQGTAAVAVTSQPITSISITPANPTTYVGVAIPLTATGTAGVQQISLTQSATWTSSNSAVATVSNAAGLQGFATGVSPGSSTINALFAGIAGSTPLDVSSATITKLTIIPLNPSISVGSTQQFKATGTFSDGNTVDLTAQVTWTSSNPNVAPITSVGLASGALGGGQTTTITATFTQPAVGQGQNPITVTDQTLLTVN